jgi:hypothetical protein
LKPEDMKCGFKPVAGEILPKREQKAFEGVEPGLDGGYGGQQDAGQLLVTRSEQTSTIEIA